MAPWAYLTLFLCVAIAVIAPDVSSARVASRMTTNLSNVKTLYMACLNYADDHGDKLPPPEKWLDAITPYLPSTPEIADPYRSDGGFGYAINADVAGKSLSDIFNPSGTILIYETKRAGRNLSTAGAQIADDAAIHNIATVGFADGAARWLTSARLSDAASHPDDFRP